MSFYEGIESVFSQFCKCVCKIVCLIDPFLLMFGSIQIFVVTFCSRHLLPLYLNQTKCMNIYLKFLGAMDERRDWLNISMAGIQKVCFLSSTNLFIWPEILKKQK